MISLAPHSLAVLPPSPQTNGSMTLRYHAKRRCVPQSRGSTRPPPIPCVHSTPERYSTPPHAPDATPPPLRDLTYIWRPAPRPPFGGPRPAKPPHRPPSFSLVRLAHKSPESRRQKAAACAIPHLSCLAHARTRRSPPGSQWRSIYKHVRRLPAVLRRPVLTPALSASAPTGPGEESR